MRCSLRNAGILPCSAAPSALARLNFSETLPPRMSQNPIDRYHFERQISYARPIIIFLSILALLERQPSPENKRTISFLIAWLVVSILVVEVQQILRNRPWHLPLACDILALGIFVYLSPSHVAVWFPYLFICYVAGTRWGIDATL